MRIEGPNFETLHYDSEVIIRQYPVELGEGRPNLDLVIVGSLENSVEENQRALGIFGAQYLGSKLIKTKQQGLKLCIDMPTGASPEPIYDELARMVNRGLDLSTAVWFGHEADFLPQPDSSLDYESQRRKILKKLGISVVDITTTEAVSGQSIQGNFVPMHLSKPVSQARGEMTNTALELADQYDRILETLLGRPDIVSLGIHGVGGDAHGWGELQLFQMWPEMWPLTANTFFSALEEYNYLRGLWRLPNDGGFHSQNNALWQNHSNLPNVRYLLGLGRKIMQQLDSCLEIFNNRSKLPALRETLKGLDGLIHLDNEQVLKIQPRPSEGEALLPEFIAYAQKLSQSGFEISGFEGEENQSCFTVVQQILRSLRKSQKPITEEVLFPLWRLINRYFGSQTPVSKMILERANLGKSTILVTTTDAIKETELELLVN